MPHNKCTTARVSEVHWVWQSPTFGWMLLGVLRKRMDGGTLVATRMWSTCRRSTSRLWWPGSQEAVICPSGEEKYGRRVTENRLWTSIHAKTAWLIRGYMGMIHDTLYEQ